MGQRIGDSVAYDGLRNDIYGIAVNVFRIFAQVNDAQHARPIFPVTYAMSAPK